MPKEIKNMKSLVMERVNQFLTQGISDPKVIHETMLERHPEYKGYLHMFTVVRCINMITNVGYTPFVKEEKQNVNNEQS